jgi:hypothetical protein
MRDPINWLKEYGRIFIPALLPADIPRGNTGDCFDHCLLIAAKCDYDGNKKYRYVEGMARDPLTGDWILHAWLTDAHGVNAYDPTWKAHDNAGAERPVPTDYRGVAMATQLVVRFVTETEYKSVFANYSKAPRLAKQAIASRI